MERADRPLEERPDLLPEAVKARLWRVHPLAVQAAIAIDSVMLPTFGAQHERKCSRGLTD
jgi:hypothetical protein